MQEEELAVLKTQGTVTAFFCIDQWKKRVRGQKNPQNSLEEYILPSDRFMTSLNICPFATTGQKDPITSTDNQVFTKELQHCISLVQKALAQ